MQLKIHKLQRRQVTALLKDRHIRMQISLYLGLLVNLVYAIFKLVTGIQYQSVWFVTVAVFYAVLSLMRFTLVRSVRRYGQKDEKARYIHGLHSYRFCGYLMFVLAVAMGGIVIQMVWKNECYYYPGYVSYLSAVYAFSCLVSAVINVVRYRDLRTPELAAAKLLILAKSCMSLLAMQTSMLAQFGNNIQFRQLMNSFSGGCTCTVIFCMAIFMVVRVQKEIKRSGTHRY